MPRKRPENDDDAPAAGLPPLEPILADQRNDKLVELAALKAEIKALEAREEQLSEALMTGLFEEGLLEYEIPGQLVARVQTKVTRTLQATELIARGVAADVIEAATKVTTSSPSLRLYPKAAKSE
jgi:hypothetical protein